MTREEIVALTNRVFEEYFEIEPERLVSQAKIFEDFGFDSLDIVDLVVALQKEFKVQIREDERVRSLRTLGDLYEYILTLEREKELTRAAGR